MTTDSKLLSYSKLHLFGIELAFLELHGYYKVMEDFLDNEKLRLETRFSEEDLLEEAKTNLEFPREYYNHLQNQYSERHWELSILYPHNFRASFLGQIISFIEFELKKICDFYQTLNNEIFGINDLKGGSDIENCKKYLQKVCNVDFEKLQPEWNFINNAKTIRNKVTHHQGIIDLKDNDLKKFVNSHKGLSFKEDNLTVSKNEITHYTLIICRKDFCDELLTITELFFKKLFEDQLKHIS